MRRRPQSEPESVREALDNAPPADLAPLRPRLYGAFGRNEVTAELYAAVWTRDQLTAINTARARDGVVVELPIIADYGKAGLTRPEWRGVSWHDTSSAVSARLFPDWATVQHPCPACSEDPPEDGIVIVGVVTEGDRCVIGYARRQLR